MSLNLFTCGTHPLPLLSSFFLLQSPFLFPSFSFYASLFLLFWRRFLFFRMVFSVMRPCAFHLIFWGAGAHPFRLCPISVKIDTLESFTGWKSWLWISKWIFGGASVCFSISSGADARAKMFGLLQNRYCATYIQHQHSIKVFRCSRWSLWWNCFANWFYLVVCLVKNVDKRWPMLCLLGELNDNDSVLDEAAWLTGFI